LIGAGKNGSPYFGEREEKRGEKRRPREMKEKKIFFFIPGDQKGFDLAFQRGEKKKKKDARGKRSR